MCEGGQERKDSPLLQMGMKPLRDTFPVRFRDK